MYKTASYNIGYITADLVKQAGFISDFVANRVGSPIGFIDNWAQGKTVSGLKDQVSSENIQKRVGEAASNIFTPDNIGRITASIAQGKDPSKILRSQVKTTGNVNEDLFNKTLSNNIGEGFTKAIKNSDKLSLPTSIAMNGPGALLNRAGGFIMDGLSGLNQMGKSVGFDAKGWGEDIFGIGGKKSSNVSQLANTISKPLSNPSSPAMVEAGDDVAGIIEEAVGEAADNNFNTFGKTLFHAAGGNFGRAFGAMSGNNQSMQVTK